MTIATNQVPMMNVYSFTVEIKSKGKYFIIVIKDGTFSGKMDEHSNSVLIAVI